MTKYRVLSLFSGTGGLDLGFVMTGKYKILVANDIKDYMARTYSINFKAKITREIKPGEFPQIVLGDVERLDFSALKGEDVDVIIGGPPCQDFSVLRASTAERGGILVKRGRLYAHFVRALVVLQPKAFVFENVPGLISANKGLAYKTIVDDFINLRLRWSEIKKSLNGSNNNNNLSSNVKGYTLIFNEVVDATAFGVAQRRRRLIIVGLRNDLIKSRSVFELATIFKKLLYRKYGLLQKYPLTTLEVFEGKVLPELQDRYVEIMKEYEKVWEEVGTTKAREWKRKVWDKLSFDVIKDYLFFNRIPTYREDELEEAINKHKEALREAGYYGKKVTEICVRDRSLVPPPEPPEVKEKVRMIPPGENYEFLIGSRWELRKKGVSQIYRRLNPLTPSYTVIAYGGGGMAMYHYERSRSALTIREKARLQSFPDKFVFTGSLSQMKAEVGEAVPPLMAKAIAEALAQVLDDLA